MIRPATRFDINHLIAAAEARYPAFGRNEAIAWLMQAMARPDDVLVLWSPNGGAVATIAQPFWGGPLRCHLLFLVVKKAPGMSRRAVMEGVELMRHIDHWRQTKGAQSFHFGQETGANFRVLAKLLGAKEAAPMFELGPTSQSVAAELFTQKAQIKPVETSDRRVVSALEQVLRSR